MEVLQIVLISFLSGFLLNFMPCVLPILGIKLQSLTGISNKQEVKTMCLFTCLGIMFFMLVMGAFFEIIKQLFGFFYWGFQLQNPFFISFLLFIMIFLTFVLQGKIIINPNFSGENFKSKKLESFAYGFLIVVFSISCTAPVIGSAIAIASAFKHFYDLWLVMFFMGLGLCLPYILFIFFPSIVLKINKARIISGFVKNLSLILILLTVAFLVYVLYSVSNIWITIFSLLLMLSSSFAYIKFKNFFILLLAQLLVFLIIFIGVKKDGNLQNNLVQSTPFNVKRLNDYVEKGHIVIVNIDASWCVNCKGNNLLTFNTDEFRTYINQRNLIFMKGDLSVSNREIEIFMSKFGIYAVPFTVVFSPKVKEGKVMPVFLTSQILIKEIESYGF